MTTIQDENFPYFIVAPDYRESSLGIQVMHRLCHLLNESGRQAWMVNCTVNPAWNTPAVSGKELREYQLRGGLFTVIYPEVVSGNPHRAPMAVRYMLNQEGVINGNDLEAGPDDLFFWYRPEFAGKYASPRILNIECYDLDLFQDDQPEKSCDLLYLNRVPLSAVDFSRLPPGIEILSMRNPLTLAELAAKLKTARTLYSYEASGTALLAILCGCPVVGLTAPGYEKYAMTATTLAEYGGVGFCWDDHPATLEAARTNLWQMRDTLLARREQTQEQIQQLVDMTQQKLRQHQQALRQGRLENWLVQRHLTPNLRDRLTLASPPRMLVAVFDDPAQPDHLLLTLDTLAQRPAFVQVVVIAAQNMAVPADMLVMPADEWHSWLQQATAECAFDWLQCIPAGSFYSAESWPVLAHFLSKQTDALAVYSDELWLNAAGDAVPHLKPHWDWDLFSAAPASYLKRCLLSRQALQRWSGEAQQYPQALEVALMQRIALHGGAEAIRHYPDMLCILPEPQLSEDESLETAQVLEHSLQLMGYPAASVQIQPGMTMQLLYGHAALPRVSLILLAGSSLATLERAITSLLQHNNWPHTELLVVNHRHDDSTLNSWLAGLATIDPTRIRVIDVVVDWQPVALRNAAAAQATGEYLCFIEPQLIFLLDNWLAALMNHALRPEVVLVGPKLIHTEQHILSAGLIAGYRGLAGHIGQGERWDSLIRGGYLQSDRQSRLLNGQCLLVRKDCWQQLGGLDERYADLAVAEIDFALKVARAGHRAIWTPHSVVATDGKARVLNAMSAEASKLLQHWGRDLLCDPGYPLNYSLYGDAFSVDESLKQIWPAFSEAQVPRVVFVHGDKSQPNSARLLQILNAMAEQQQIALLSYDALAPWVVMRLQPDVLIFAADVAERQRENIATMVSMHGCRCYCLPEARFSQQSGSDLLQASWLNGWLVWSEELQQWLQKRKQTTFPLPPLVAMPDMPPVRAPRHSRLRVLCETSQLSAADVRFFARVVSETATFIDWVIRGAAPASWIESISEIHRTESGAVTANELISLNVDMAVLFRLNQDENRGKDDLSLLDYQAAGLPVLCSDITSLRHRGTASYVRNKEHLWVTALLDWHQQAEWPPVLAPDPVHQLTADELATFWQQAGIHFS
ncbi:glycosyltransferase family 2 protein [Pantoea sp. At-9b]|uniref:glycosyltransferase family 2 protein n=1 Tax=Pantoea sp. (strain At-9b) TaxID=592316 RepID=UPI0001B3F1A3|nr:glycosyltransferase [Pantoea sp. At-9b]ADU69675.1 glycosyl transferase family 2 [Pantoea sp. At-9b]